MKSAIIYYSFSGNTHAVARTLEQFLQTRGSVDVVELQPLDESKSFFGQARRAFFRKEAQLPPMNFDYGAYDMVCVGTPVWAFGPAPAMTTFLKQCSGLQGKEATVFTTYGSGTGNNKCIRMMSEALSKKGIYLRQPGNSICSLSTQGGQQVFAMIDNQLFFPSS